MRIYVLVEWDGNSTEIDDCTVLEAYLDKAQAEAKAQELTALEPRRQPYQLPPEARYEVKETELYGVLDRPNPMPSSPPSGFAIPENERGA